MTDAKARAIGVLVSELEHPYERYLWGDAEFTGEQLGYRDWLTALDAIAELLSPSPEPANFYEYRV